jgi:hypothetical protein
MFKLAPSTYTLGGVTDSWQKVREVRQVAALVYAREGVKDNPNAWVLLGAVGPIPEDELGKWREVIEWNGKHYVALGRTFSSALDAPPGSIVLVNATELFYNPTDGVLHWFQPTVVARARQVGPMSTDDVIALVQPEEVREGAGMAKALAFLSTASERTVPLVKAAEERMVYGIVLEPETVDAQGDIYDAATIRQAAHIFMEKFGGLGLMHRYIINGSARILETWIAPCDLDLNGTAVRKGTWLLAVRVIDDDLWKAVKEGEFTGFSIGGSARRIAGRANN